MMLQVRDQPGSWRCVFGPGRGESAVDAMSAPALDSRQSVVVTMTDAELTAVIRRRTAGFLGDGHHRGVCGCSMPSGKPAARYDARAVRCTADREPAGWPPIG